MLAAASNYGFQRRKTVSPSKYVSGTNWLLRLEMSLPWYHTSTLACVLWRGGVVLCFDCRGWQERPFWCNTQSSHSGQLHWSSLGWVLQHCGWQQRPSWDFEVGSWEWLSLQRSKSTSSHWRQPSSMHGRTHFTWDECARSFLVPRNLHKIGRKRLAYGKGNAIDWRKSQMIPTKMGQIWKAFWQTIPEFEGHSVWYLASFGYSFGLLRCPLEISV